MPSNSPHVCVPCRTVFKQTGTCPKCGQGMKWVGSKWRAPKKSNDRAWRLVESGDWLWDKKALEGRRLSVWSAHWPKEMLERARRANPKYGRNVTDR